MPNIYDKKYFRNFFREAHGIKPRQKKKKNTPPEAPLHKKNIAEPQARQGAHRLAV
jgi:hypothetical protein